MNQDNQIQLVPFESPAANKIACSVSVKEESGLLLLDFAVAGPLDAISIPPEHESPGFMPKLWLHTCFECFLRRRSSQSYIEWNFSLDCNWWMCSFESYRKPADRQPANMAPQDFQILLRESGIFLKAAVACPDTAGLLVGPAVIIEHAGGGKSHWAVRHPDNGPDFHDPQTCGPLVLSASSRK